MDASVAAEELARLRSQIDAFLLVEAPDSTFYAWRESVLTLLESALGRKSQDYIEFYNLRFELSPIRIGDIEQRHMDAIRNIPQLSKAEPIQVDTSHYFHERLHDAREILLVCIITLSKPPNAK